jgi:hypothetical protein
MNFVFFPPFHPFRLSRSLKWYEFFSFSFSPLFTFFRTAYTLRAFALRAERRNTKRVKIGGGKSKIHPLLNDQIHPADDLKKNAVDFFRRFPSEVMATDGWKKAKQEHPYHSIWVLVVDILENVHRR